MKRLAKEVNSVAIDLEAAQNDPAAVGRDLVKDKGGEDFLHAASKKVDYDGEERLYFCAHFFFVLKANVHLISSTLQQMPRNNSGKSSNSSRQK